MFGLCWCVSLLLSKWWKWLFVFLFLESEVTLFWWGVKGTWLKRSRGFFYIFLYLWGDFVSILLCQNWVQWSWFRFRSKNLYEWVDIIFNIKLIPNFYTLRKSINGLVNKVHAMNITSIIPELFVENLILGIQLFCRPCMNLQIPYPGFTNVLFSTRNLLKLECFEWLFFSLKEHENIMTKYVL